MLCLLADILEQVVSIFWVDEDTGMVWGDCFIGKSVGGKLLLREK
jgi:hypothetical protein